MYLLIDPSLSDAVRLSLFANELVATEIYQIHHGGLLQSIDQFLAAHNLTPGEVHGIAVVVGAGTFTRTRLAVTAANTWSFAKDIPVCIVSLKEKEEYWFDLSNRLRETRTKYITALYSGEPHIGKGKTLVA